MVITYMEKNDSSRFWGEGEFSFTNVVILRFLSDTSENMEWLTLELKESFG